MSENIAPEYTDRNIVIDEPRPYPAFRRALAVALGWMVPGAGHLVLGRVGRGLLFFVVLVGAFVTGLALHARLYWPAVADPPSFLHFDLISLLWSFSQLGTGLCYVISYALGLGFPPQPEASTFEYGNTFTFLAGLLNYLVVLDAYDISAGRKR